MKTWRQPQEAFGANAAIPFIRVRSTSFAERPSFDVQRATMRPLFLMRARLLIFATRYLCLSKTVDAFIFTCRDIVRACEVCGKEEHAKERGIMAMVKPTAEVLQTPRRRCVMQQRASVQKVVINRGECS